MLTTTRVSHRFDERNSIILPSIELPARFMSLERLIYGGMIRSLRMGCQDDILGVGFDLSRRQFKLLTRVGALFFAAGGTIAGMESSQRLYVSAC
jgi:hypothetical protein